MVTNVKTQKGKVTPKSGPKKTRRYSQAYKIKILKLGAQCKNLSELNDLLQREKLHSAQLSKWWREFSDHLPFEKNFLQPSIEKQQPPVTSTNQEKSENIDPYSHETTIDPREILAKIWRRKWLLFSTMALSMLLAIIFINSVTPSYTSRALVMIGNRDANLAVNGLVPSLQVDVGTMQNELEILRSYNIAERVINKLNLDQLPEFNPALKEKSKLLKFIEAFRPPAHQPDSEKSDSSIPHTNVPVIETFLKKINLALVGESRLIELKTTSHDPELAAKIANSILDIYLKDQIDTKYSVTNKTNVWLNKRVNDLRQKVADAETAVEEYRKKRGLLQTSKGITLNSQQLSELNTQLVLASTDRAEKEARLRQMQKLAGKNIESAAEVINSVIIQKLREQETVLEGNLAELSTSYGPKHPKIINLLAEKKEIQSKISKEIRKVVNGLKNEVNIARIREKQLKAQLKNLENKLAGSNEQEIQLRALEREAEATRKLLNTFLTRFKETSEQSNMEVQRADAKVISYATPARKPSFPKKIPILVLALFGSLLLGLLSVFIRELFDKGYRSGIQIEKDTGLPSLGLVPKLGRFRIRNMKPEIHVQKYPASPISEAIRSIYTNMTLGEKSGHSARVIQFTSAYPDEGKTTIAQCLAILKRQGGMKTVLIDADMRSPAIHSSFKIKPKPGLAEYLSGKTALHQIIVQDKKTGVYLIPAGHAKKSPTDLLPSEKLDTLLSDLSEVFDLIILDSPPVLAIPDARIISSKVDMTAFVVKWADTRKEVVRFALKQLSDSRASRVGTVLTMVDAKKHAQYSFADSGMYTGHFKQYYIGGL